MTKFPNREDRGYDRILGELQRWKRLTRREEETSTRTTTGQKVKQDGNHFEDTHAWGSQVVQGTIYNANSSQSF